MTDEVNEMYVLAATNETQGDRDDDYGWTIDGELVFVPTIECRAPGCGCDRGFAGVTSHRATTTAMVVHRPELDSGDDWDAIFDAMRDRGYGLAGDDDLADAVDGLVAAVQALGAVAGDRTVVGRSGPRLSVRRAGSCQTP